MFRNGATRSLLRSLNTQATLRTSSPAFRPQLKSQLCTAAKRPQNFAMKKPLALQLMRAKYATAPMDTIDKKVEEKIGAKKLPSDPETVSLTSSTHPVNSEIGVQEAEKDTDMMAGVKADMQTIRDTFSLEDVPRQAYYIGLAGVLPYVATSVSTIYCAWEINHAAAHGAGFAMSGKTAELLLHILEPLQVGYGAAIISFLGAIHWGLEFAQYGGAQGYPRYSIGVFATALAWPTIMLPVEYALISQFLIFNFLYYNDSRASKTGWAPAWYGVYRFVLTFIVGASIVASLIGRGQIAGQIGHSSGPAQRVKELREHQAQEAENEEEQRRKFLAEKDEEEAEE
ncbi:hypothetical protein DOTSEDRAFT_71275 [Dothistroma septosporum NZE10]|uniref:MNN4-regulates the mannosylphosphorylation n=1 Tax=Dothistroma septosporum (strain NZE10 / CBS 128990) TaxID=675120 RepID=N1PSW8_DOTSN|nr:hypothetical protein DOTSEDRAFT_71275 [Dothistroma septosporum NZE10]